jgi:amidase
MGYISDLPIGFSFIAGAWQEADIIAMAYAYEQASNKRRAPEFKLPVY